MGGTEKMSKYLDMIIVGLLALIVGILVFFDANEVEDNFIPPPPPMEVKTVRVVHNDTVVVFRMVDDSLSLNRSILPQLRIISDIIRERGDISDKEMKALKFLSTEYKEGDIIYESLDAFMDQNNN